MRLSTSRPRLTSRVAGLAAVGVVAALALTGCIKVDADVTINSDAEGTGTLSFELQKEAAGFLGISDLTTFTSQLADGELSGSGLGALDNCESSESDTGFVYSCEFTNEPFTETDGIWTITKDGDSVVFRMVNEGQTGTEGSDASALLGDASMGSIDVNVTFPGPITTLSGDAATKTSDTTATISGTMTSAIDVTITSDASSGGLSVSSLLVVLLVLAVVILIIVVIIVMVMRRRMPADAVVVPPTADVVPADAVPADAVPTDAVPATEAVVAETVVADETPTETIAVDETLEPPADGDSGQPTA